MQNRRNHILLPLVFFILFPLLTPQVAPGAGGKSKIRFPLYPVIADNVGFWEDVYGKYSSRQGILHDKYTLTRIYGVVDLVDWNTPGAARINTKLIKTARLHYKTILTRLGRGKKPKTKEEKRIAALFPKMRHSRFLKARDNIRLQIGQRDRFREGVIRAGAYLPRIRQIFRSYGLPEELGYLPHVESSFNPFAHSKAGAVGLWQFTRGTGRDFMRINHVVDERYDPFVSTHAAARLLKKNYRQLGTWPLALTAYNYGLAGMVRALKTRKTYENIFRNHQTRLFKFAARNFYSEFLAAYRTARKLEKDPSLIQDRPVAILDLRLKNYTDAGGIRKYFGLSKKDFARLNPALRKPVLTGKKYIPKGYLLHLPATNRIKKLIPGLGNRFYHSRQLPDRIHIVQRGDTAGSIARQYGISLKTLIKANHLDRKATIRIGQKLILPGKTRQKGSRVITLKDRAKRKP